MTKAQELSAAFGYLYTEEVEALRQLAAMLPPNPIVVNIGAGAGTSSLCFLEARSDLNLVTVDIQKEGSPFGSLEGEVNGLRAAGFYDTKRYSQIHGDSKVVGREQWKRYVDAVFIDGDHSYEGAVGDIDAWLPHIKPGGYIALHDYTSDHWPDVVAAVKARLSNFEQVLHVKTVIVFRKP